MKAPRTPAQWFAAAIGAALIALGTLALVVGPTTDNIFHTAVGALALVIAAIPQSARRRPGVGTYDRGDPPYPSGPTTAIR